ncbi:D-alanine--D-alanine ligase [Thalassotalea sp. LPB0316]|uniref:D-alanine--D-alanine ligase n=1 Tax=Thalassotalea sp. LPB0316 TaxID=2769490 RepID=UPI001865FD7E|nr:D-alanine--D-alanine ligase [Thalassotalea sp. LPB0316]QOL25901.1 D-alanine--D-alanine ligase [Thalassotalea sp. LPB0316]
MTSLFNQKLAVLYGGSSAEREVSLASGKAVAKGLEQAGFTDVALVDTKGFDLHKLVEMGVDRVFIALHGRGGEDGTLQGALEYLGIPYTGSGVLGSALAMDKIKTKQIIQSVGLPTAAFVIVDKASYVTEQAEQIIADLGGKVMVKPSCEGSSIGMAIATNAQELNKALAHAFDFDDAILVEAWIDGLEYTVAILGEQALPPIHMQTPNAFYDYQAKYQSTTTQYHCPAGLSEQDEAEIRLLAEKAFKAIGTKGWGRVDFMRNQQGQWQILEINTVPGMTETSLVPKAAKVQGLSFSQLVTRIVELSE